MMEALALTGVRAHHVYVPDANQSRALEACLTPAELARAAAIRSELRRREHVASRVLAKHLMLDRIDDLDETMREISISELLAVAAEKYRTVEVFREDGAPRVFRRGAALPGVHLSIAHSAGTTAVGVSTGSPMGIDVATVEAHAPSFHRVHYSQAERDWIACADERASSPLSTMLWTLKECVIKAGGAPQATLWGYDEVEVLVERSARDVAADLEAGVTLTIPIRLSPARVATARVSRIANSILSFVAGIQEA